MSTPTPESETTGTPTDPLLSVTESAAYLSVSRSYVEKLIYVTKTLPAVRIANGVGRGPLRIRQSSLDALMEPVTAP